MKKQSELNQQFSLKQQLEFIEQPNGFVMININNHYAKATISLYGGHIVSFKPHSQQQELLFLSQYAVYQHGKSIRGGIPICWPWFGDAPDGQELPAHGFARNQPWRVVATQALEDGATRVVLSLVDNEQSKRLWPYEFELELEVIIGESLQLNLTTKNTGKKAFSITQALHSYFNISHIDKIELHGLDGSDYLDKLTGFDRKQQAGKITVEQETDRVYIDSPQDVSLNDSGFDRALSISSTGSKTIVVWNPGQQTAKAMIDLADSDYQHFICVETANSANDSIDIAAGDSHTMTANYQF